MKQCGIETFMTTKISWNQYNTIPNDLFWWKGIDGSKILTISLMCRIPDRTGGAEALLIMEKSQRT